MKTVETWVKEFSGAVSRHLQPGGIYHTNWQRLARELGDCLSGFPESDVKKALPTLYSEVLVRNCFAAGICIPCDAAPFNKLVWKTFKTEQEKR